jgi:hypothetical protein
MDDHAGGLVHDDQVRVLEEDVERDRLGRRLDLGGTRQARAAQRRLLWHVAAQCLIKTRARVGSDPEFDEAGAHGRGSERRDGRGTAPRTALSQDACDGADAGDDRGRHNHHVTLLVIRLNAGGAPVRIDPGMFVVPDGVGVVGISVVAGRTVIVADDGTIRVYDSESRAFLQEMDLP